jgi:hypothetical protein
MATREQMIAELRRQDMIEKLRADDAAKAAAPMPSEAPAPNTPTAPESALGGAQQGVTFGFADEAKGAIDALLGKTGKLFLEEGTTNPYADKSMSENYTAGRDEARKEYEAQAKANPTAFMAGNIAGGIMVPGIGAGKVLAKAGMTPGVAQSLAKTGIEGAVAGLGGAEGSAVDQLQATGIGGGLGAAGTLAGTAVNKGVSAVSNATGRAADFFTEVASGVNRTQKQREELAEMIASGKIRPGEAGRLIREKDLLKLSPGKTSDKIREYLETTVRPRLDSLKNNAANIDPAQLASKIRAKAGKYTDEESASIRNRLTNTAKQYDKRVETSPYIYSGARPEGIPNIPATEIAAAKTRVGKDVDNFLSTASRKQAGKDMYGVYAEELKDAVERGAGPKSRAAFEDLNKQSHLLIPAQESALERAANQAGITPTSLRGAGYGLLGAAGGYQASGEDSSALGNMAKGFAAGFVGRKYGPSVAAKSLGKVEKMMQQGGKFQAVLQKAFERGGPAAVNSTHYLLMQSDPEYRQKVKDHEDPDTK